MDGDYSLIVGRRLFISKPAISPPGPGPSTDRPPRPTPSPTTVSPTGMAPTGSVTSSIQRLCQILINNQHPVR